MGKKEPIILVFMICILSSPAVFGQSGRDKQDKIFNPYSRNNFSFRNNLGARLGGYKKKPFSTFPHQVYTFPVRDNFYQLVPVNVTVRCKRPVSEFEAAYLFDHYRLKKSSGLRMDDEPGLIVSPGDCPKKPPRYAPERNPYVDYHEQNGSFLLRNRRDDFGDFSGEKLCKLHSKSRFPEGQSEQEMLHSDIQREANQRLASNDDSTKKIQISDPKRIIRSKAKIHSYRDGKGKLVFTNYGGNKGKSIKN
jgi:hypothetical protein